MAPSDFRKLQDKHILLIGGSAGIGHAVAEAVLSAGANVTISSSSAARVVAVAASLAAAYPGRAVHGIACDLSQPTVEADLDGLFRAAVEAQGPVHHVVYTAADHLALGGLDGVDVGVIHTVAHMRMIVPILLGKVAARYLPQSHASSLTVTSGTVAEKPDKGWAVVAFVAGGLESLAKALAVDLAPVRVNVVRPGYVDTGLWSEMGEEGKNQFVEMVKQKMPTGRFAKPEDVAEAYLWLLKDGNATGTVASTDSGHLVV